MLIRSKAPLRLGLAGGGTDISSYCNKFGGHILNVTIDMYAYCIIEPTTDEKIVFRAIDRNESYEVEKCSKLEIDEVLPLHKGVYNRIVSDYNGGKPLSFIMTTYSDAPAGTGLGSSSTMVVAILKAYMEWLNLPLGEYDMADLAYQIERIDLKLLGGKQDQYAATFGGFNFMEFYDKDRVIVNPLRLKRWIKNELETSLLLYFTGVSRDSSTIIKGQFQSVQEEDEKKLQNMHILKKEAVKMKEAVLMGDFYKFGECLLRGWDAKKQTAESITNTKINQLYDFIMRNGGKAAKLSGAGGGGFMMIYCNPIERLSLRKKLEQFGGKTEIVSFTENGTQAWTIY